MSEALNIPQGSDEWFQARIGKVTASRVADAVARTKTGWGAGRANYMAQLTAERLTGTPAETFSNAAMQWGTETEPFAREAYEIATGELVEEVGFVPHPTIGDSGASPDGLVGNRGLLEIKCPNTATHIQSLLTEKIDKKYMLQMQWQLACTEREWCDFVSFDPRMPPELQLFQTRVVRDTEVIAELEAGVMTFLAELDHQVTQLQELAA